MRGMPLVECPGCATRQYAVTSFVTEVLCVACGTLLAAPKNPRFGGWRAPAAFGRAGAGGPLPRGERRDGPRPRVPAGGRPRVTGHRTVSTDAL
jgi:hypothetical protein